LRLDCGVLKSWKYFPNIPRLDHLPARICLGTLNLPSLYCLVEEMLLKEKVGKHLSKLSNFVQIYETSATFAPFRLWKISLRSSIHSSTSSLFSSFENSLAMVTRIYSHSVCTSLNAGHILGPPENGVYSQVGRIVSHRSGLK
jgi:hypothetical protein